MSLRGKLSGLIVGLALFLAGCEESGEIGIGLDPERGRFVARYVEVPLRASVIEMDTVFTRNRERVLVGRYEDPAFGRMKSQAFSRLFLSEILEVDTTAVCDSIVATVRVDYLYGPQGPGVQRLQLHQLEDTLENINYYSRDSVGYLPDAFASTDFTLDGFDTARIDTTLRVDLPDTLGQWFLEGAAADTAIGANQNDFHEYFPGIAWIPGSDNNKIMGLDLFDPDSKITMYYRTSEDTLEYSFVFVSGLEEANYFFNAIPQRNGTPLEGLTEPYTEYNPGDGMFYVQSGTGLLTRVSLQPVLDFFDSVGNSVINSAEITLDSELYPPVLQPPPGLELLILDENNTFIDIGGRFKAILDESQQRRQNLVLRFVKDAEVDRGAYSGHLSVFAQELINGIHEDTVFALTPTTLNGSVDRLQAPDVKLLLKMYYSEIK